MQFSVKKTKILEEEGRKKHKIQSSCQSCCNGWGDRKRKKDWIIEISVSINAWPVCLTNNGAWGRRMRGREMRRRDAANRCERREESTRETVNFEQDFALPLPWSSVERSWQADDIRGSWSGRRRTPIYSYYIQWRRIPCCWCIGVVCISLSSISPHSIVWCITEMLANSLPSYSDLMLCMCTQLRARQTATRFLPPAPVIFVYIAAWLAVVQRQPAISQQLLLALALFFYFFFFFIFSIFILFFFFFVELFFCFRYFDHFSAFTLFLSLALLLFNTMRGCDNPSFPSKMYIQYVADVYIHVACK